MAKSTRLLGALFAGTALALATAGTAWGNGDKGKGSGHHHHDHVFFLFGAAAVDDDPENPANEVVRFEANSATGVFSGVARLFDEEKVQARDLDNQLESRHRFEAPDTCNGGGPRVALSIDLTNNGTVDGNAVAPFGTGGFQTPPCPVETWLYEDFTGADGITGLAPGPSTGDPGRGEQNGGPNEEGEWDVTQLIADGLVITGNPFLQTWSQVETALHTQFPNHRVCRAIYVDDVGAGAIFTPAETTGESHADLISLGDATLTGSEDIGKAPRNLPSDPCKVKIKGGGHHDHDDD